MNEMKTKVAEITQAMSLLNRHNYNIADAAGQLESRGRYARSALLGEMDKVLALEASAAGCPDGKTIEQWRIDAEKMGEAIISELAIVSEQINKEIDLRAALVDDLPE